MHTLMVIVGGLVLLGVFCLFGGPWDADMSGLATAARFFIPVWIVVTVVNLWVGVTRAGYTVREELPILVLVFAIPAIIAAVIIWQFART